MFHMQLIQPVNSAPVEKPISNSNLSSISLALVFVALSYGKGEGHL